MRLRGVEEGAQYTYIQQSVLGKKQHFDDKHVLALIGARSVLQAEDARGLAEDGLLCHKAFGDWVSEGPPASAAGVGASNSLGPWLASTLKTAEFDMGAAALQPAKLDSLAEALCIELGLRLDHCQPWQLRDAARNAVGVADVLRKLLNTAQSSAVLAELQADRADRASRGGYLGTGKGHPQMYIVLPLADLDLATALWRGRFTGGGTTDWHAPPPPNSNARPCAARCTGEQNPVP